MVRQFVKYPLTIGLLAFALSLIVTLMIDSPFPYLASLFIAFLIFEISFYHYFSKEKRRGQL